MSSNKELMQRRSQAVPRGVGQIHPIFADRAENCRVWDVEGREYLDFAGGIAVLNTGHLHPKVVAAVEAQLKKLSHTCFQVLAYEPYLELCEIMNQKVPGDFAGTVAKLAMRQPFVLFKGLTFQKLCLP
ncbi:aminotransferase class III-fold pyridoxal phosphate-dependent enzyme, partial [Escherichia coli]|uniref:aminotransferase class III-fold pyridoxal phosphate-dependent enzyme n=1 Tax=Escherichia coli TaxID=562 RepID=UPI001FCE4B28